MKQSVGEDAHSFHLVICYNLVGSSICVDLGQHRIEFDEQRISLNVENRTSFIELTAETCIREKPFTSLDE